VKKGGEARMKRRALVYPGAMLGIVAVASTFAEPMVAAQGNPGTTVTISVTCRSTGDLFVDYTYSGLSGAVRGIDFHVDTVGDNVDAVTSRSGEVIQAFNQSTVGHPIVWGAVNAAAVGHTGKAIAGATAVWDNGTSVTC
jgi:hypothetical protein